MPSLPPEHSTTVETALLVACPAAEPVVADHRILYDAAARDCMPAHLTVGYPFKPTPTPSDHHCLATLFAGVPGFTARFSKTGWFDNDVLFLRPDDPSPFVDLVHRVGMEFPDYPLYGGAFPEVVPHLTIGHDSPVATLAAVDREVVPQLPVEQRVTTVELWTGPAVGSGGDRWRKVRSYPLGMANGSNP